MGKRDKIVTGSGPNVQCKHQVGRFTESAHCAFTCYRECSKPAADLVTGALHCPLTLICVNKNGDQEKIQPGYKMICVAMTTRLRRETDIQAVDNQAGSRHQTFEIIFISQIPNSPSCPAAAGGMWF